MEAIFFPLHIISLIFSAYYIVRADHDGFSWFTGRVDTLPADRLKKYHKMVIIGLVLMIITGAFLFWPARDYYLHTTAFILKMTCVALLIANSFVIGSFMNVAIERPYRELALKEKIPLMLSGAVSFCAWVGAAILAFFIAG